LIHSTTIQSVSRKTKPQYHSKNNKKEKKAKKENIGTIHRGQLKYA
jgi:hypothetical protein